MQLLHAIFLGFFILILTYLLLKNSKGVAAIFKSGDPAVVDVTKTLQGR